MKFSIITPTIQRESLAQCCASVDGQTLIDWEHVIMIDAGSVGHSLWGRIESPKRHLLWCAEPHRNGGNSCRHNAYERISGDYVIYLDDDNYLADSSVLADIDTALANKPAWAIFPISRLGGRFFSDPPRNCFIDTLNLVLSREVALWPDTTAYGSDGILVDSLLERKVPYASFPNFRPIGIVPTISFCK